MKQPSTSDVKQHSISLGFIDDELVLLWDEMYADDCMSDLFRTNYMAPDFL